MSKPKELPVWDLKNLYKSLDDPKLKADYDLAKTKALDFQKKYRGKITNKVRANFLLKALEEMEEIIVLSVKPELYAHLFFSENTSDQNRGAFMQRIKAQFVEIFNNLIFFELAVSKMDAKVLQKFINNPVLENYRHYLEKALDQKPHLLSEKEERIFNDKSLTSYGAFVRLFDQEKNGRAYEVKIDGKIKKHSESEIMRLLHDSKRSVRKAAAMGFSKGLEEDVKRETYIFNMLSADKSMSDRYHKFKNPEQSRHLSNEIDRETVDLMVNTVVKNYKIVSDYYNFKKKLLKLDTLFLYDRHAPVSKVNQKYTFEKAKEIVLQSFKDFSPQFLEIAERFFKQNWIHAKGQPGKMGGAYCSSGTPDTNPFILMNYTGKIRDVTTLAHELGHGINDWLMKKQTVLNYNVPLILAETASVFAEMLVFDSLIGRAKDPRVKLDLLMGKIEDAFATVFRQTSMHKFEQAFHDERQKKGELADEEINKIWFDTQKTMYGKSIMLTEDYKYWWGYIPHFRHVPFYVYAYAFGQLLSMALFAQYKKQGKSFIPKYTKFLSSGGSKAPKELLAELGVDVTKAEFWQDGLNMINDLLKQAKKISKTI